MAELQLHSSKLEEGGIIYVTSRWPRLRAIGRYFLKSVKYTMFAVLLSAAAFADSFNISAQSQLILSVILCLYGLGALALLRPQTLERIIDIRAQVTENILLRRRVIRMAAYLLTFRAIFLLCALAYVARTVSAYAPAMIVPAGLPLFSSLVVLVLEHTFPPLAAIAEYAFPNVPKATLNPTDWVALSYRIFVYVCYSAIGLAVVKGIWIAAYNARGLERLEKAVQVNEVLMSDDFTL